MYDIIYMLVVITYSYKLQLYNVSVTCSYNMLLEFYIIVYSGNNILKYYIMVIFCVFWEVLTMS